MHHLVFEAAAILGLGASAFAALLMFGEGVGLAALLIRTMIVGGGVFLFSVLGGSVAGRIALETIAKREQEMEKVKVQVKEQTAAAQEKRGAEERVAAMKKAKEASKKPEREDEISRSKVPGKKAA